MAVTRLKSRLQPESSAIQDVNHERHESHESGRQHPVLCFLRFLLFIPFLHYIQEKVMHYPLTSNGALTPRGLHVGDQFLNELARSDGFLGQVWEIARGKGLDGQWAVGEAAFGKPRHQLWKIHLPCPR